MTAQVRILVISFSRLASDPRVARHIVALQGGGYRVETCGIGAPSLLVPRHHDIPLALRSTPERMRALLQLVSRRFDAYYWSDPMVRAAEQVLAGERFDAVLANDVATLPLALRVAGTAPVLFDAHEFSPEEFSDNFGWRLVRGPYANYLCRTYLPRTKGAITVSEGIANAYRARYGIAMAVITNAAELHPDRARDADGLDKGRVRMIHHGGAIRSRHIEDMLQVMRYLDARFSLDLMLVPGTPGYLEELQRLAGKDERIRFRDPVPMERIIDVCAEYDVGLCFFRPVNLSLEYCLPNKFFEYVQARIAVAVGPSPEMARVVRQFGCGVVAEDYTPQSLARALMALTPETLTRMKQAAGEVARTHNAQANAVRLCAEMDRVLRRVA